MSSFENYKEVTEALRFLVNYFTQAHNVLNHCPGWLWDETRGGVNFESYKALVERVREDIRKREVDERAIKSRHDDLNTEDYILTFSALRIDGYKYREMVDLDTETIFGEFEKTGTFGDATPLDKLGCFFLLQRHICKWGGEQVDRNTSLWKMYRTLFLQTTDVEVPAEFLPNSLQSTSKWEYRIKPRIKTCIDIVETIHKNTKYK